MSQHPQYFHVAPRYTSGSPAMVDKMIAFRVAKEEELAFRQQQQLALNGFTYAPDWNRGLEGIVYSTQERASRMLVHDLITDAFFSVPVKEWTGHYWYARTDRDKFRLKPMQMAGGRG